MLQKIRIVLAAVCFTLITLLLLDFTGSLHCWLGWLAKVQLLPAVLALNAVVIVVLALLTLVFGRIYCSVICPLGVFQDIVSWIHGRKKKNRFSYSPAKSWLRYAMLVLLIVAVVLGLGIVIALLAPYGTYGRFVNTFLQPLYIWGNNVLASISDHFNSYAFYSKDVWLKSLPVLLVTLGVIVAIVVLAWKHGRTWCNSICPVGTTLSFLARFSWFKVRFDEDKCKNCSLCTKNCKAACIDYETHKVDYSRCVVCGNCIEKCKFGAMHYGHKPTRKQLETAKPVTEEAKAEKPDEVRRALMVGAAVMGAEAVLAQANKKVDGGLAVIEDKQVPNRSTPLTPPGSFSAANMAKRCVGCQLCVAQCPNDVLRPSNDPATFMQPVMSYERGFCRPECTRCSEVCPAGAIQPIDEIEKSSIQIGHAVWVKKNCIVLTDEVECGNCARHCPAGAIQMVPLNPAPEAPAEGEEPMEEDKRRIPVVNVERCIGCGSCEYVCPARPFSAIYVEGHEVHRMI